MQKSTNISEFVTFATRFVNEIQTLTSPINSFRIKTLCSFEYFIRTRAQDCFHSAGRVHMTITLDKVNVGHKNINPNCPFLFTKFLS